MQLSSSIVESSKAPSASLGCRDIETLKKEERSGNSTVDGKSSLG
jgi:hypothetical protein